MVNTNVKWIVLFWSILGLGLIFLGISFIHSSREYANQGYYLRGSVNIKAQKTVNMNEYLNVAIHEYGHHIFANYMTREDFKEWIKAVDKCGITSPYAKNFRSKSVRLEEEFCENLVQYFHKDPELCNEKKEVLRRYAIANSDFTL